MLKPAGATGGTARKLLLGQLAVAGNGESGKDSATRGGVKTTGLGGRV